MRVFNRMSWRLSAGIFALVLLLAAAIPAVADTGTYRILDYTVSLEPQSSGQVSLTCEQEWKVLSGNIPWITVALPNAHFSVVDFSGAVSKVYADNSGSWQGVRVDLDKTYLPGETFKINFTVLQGNLLERLTSDKKWRIDFTPGWYDRAAIDRLQITLISPVDLAAYSSVSPSPASSADKTITWERANISPGDKFTIRVECLDGGFLAATAETMEPAGGGANPWTAFIGIGVVFFIIFLITLAVRKYRRDQAEALQTHVAEIEKSMADDPAKKEKIEKGFREYVIDEGIEPDKQGKYYDRGYGGYITPAIWMAAIMSHPSPGPTSTTHTSCACACVSCACACACACAGGGAAGCSRKSLHECDKCPSFIPPTK
jgi:hypothetical protein